MAVSVDKIHINRVETNGRGSNINPLRSNDNQGQISLRNINAFSVREVTHGENKGYDHVGRLRNSPRLCYK